MRYLIEQTAIKNKLTLAKVTVFDDNNSIILTGEQEVCLSAGADVEKYIEDVYLVDQRRQPDSAIVSLELPCDIQIVQTWGEGWAQTNKGFIPPDGWVATEGWVKITYAGKELWQPPIEWTPPEVIIDDPI